MASFTKMGIELVLDKEALFTKERVQVRKYDIHSRWTGQGDQSRESV